MFFYKLIFAYVAFAFLIAFLAVEGRKGLKKAMPERRQATLCCILFLVGISPLLAFNSLPISMGGGCCVGSGGMPPVVEKALSMLHPTRDDYSSYDVVPNVIARFSQLLAIVSENSTVGGNFTVQQLGIGSFILLFGLAASFCGKKETIFLALSLVVFTLASCFVTEKLNVSHLFAVFPVIAVIMAAPFKEAFGRKGRLPKLAAVALAILACANLNGDVGTTLAFDDQKYIERLRPDMAVYSGELVSMVNGAETIIGAMDFGTAMKLYLAPSVRHVHRIEVCRRTENDCYGKFESFEQSFPSIPRGNHILYVVPSPERTETPGFSPYLFNCPLTPENVPNCGFYAEFSKLLASEGKSLKERGKVYDRTTGQPVWTVYSAE